MNAARILKQARRRAGLSQRALAAKSGMKQPAIARIESGEVNPRVATLDHLLGACGEDLELASRLGEGLDRTVIHQLLKLNPGERAVFSVEAARNLARIRVNRAR